MQTSELIARLRAALPADTAEAVLHEPEFRGREIQYLEECIRSGWVSYMGPQVDTFERELAAACGVKHVLAVVNGTSALHAALIVLGVRPGDEVIVPTLTFVATANAVALAGAVPHLADAEEEHLGLDIARLRAHLGRVARRDGDRCVNAATGRRIAAIVPVHIFGHPVDPAALDELAAEFGLPVLADATESLGSQWRGRPAPSFGTMSVLSFNGNKVLTTGGGGAMLTDDERLAREVRHLCTTAKRPHPWAFEHDRVAFNYRLPNLNAALGRAQLEQLPRFVAEKRQLAERYAESLRGLAGVTVMREHRDARSNYWLVALKLGKALAPRRDELLGALHAAGLKCRPIWTPMHRLPMFRDCPRMDSLDCAEDMVGRIINVPSSPRLARRDLVAEGA